jgi:hypothetical protein
MFDFNRRGFDLAPPLFLDPNQGTPIIDKRYPWRS